MSDAAVQFSPGDWPAPLAPASSEAAGKNALVHIPVLSRSRTVICCLLLWLIPLRICVRLYIRAIRR